MNIDDVVDMKAKIALQERVITALLKKRTESEDNKELSKLQTNLKYCDKHISGLYKKVDQLTEDKNAVQKLLEEMITERDDYLVMASLRERELQILKRRIQLSMDDGKRYYN